MVYLFINVGSSVLRDVTNVASQSASQRTEQPSDQPLAESPSQQGGQTALVSQDTIQVKARHAIDKVYKQLLDKAMTFNYN